MRVSCDQCSAGYELDLPPGAMSRGRNLKFRCTSCGHRFLVVREDGSLTEAATVAPDVDGEAPTVAIRGESTAAPPTIELQQSARSEPPPSRADATHAPTLSATGPLYLRQDGVLYQVADIASLQQWVVQQRVEPGAELSEDGQTWELAQDRPELAMFFDLLARAQAADPRLDDDDTDTAGDTNSGEPPAWPTDAPAGEGPNRTDRQEPLRPSLQGEGLGLGEGASETVTEAPEPFTEGHPPGDPQRGDAAAGGTDHLDEPQRDDPSEPPFAPAAADAATPTSGPATSAPEAFEPDDPTEIEDELEDELEEEIDPALGGLESLILALGGPRAKPESVPSFDPGSVRPPPAAAQTEAPLRDPDMGGFDAAPGQADGDGLGDPSASRSGDLLPPDIEALLAGLAPDEPDELPAGGPAPSADLAAALGPGGADLSDRLGGAADAPTEEVPRGSLAADTPMASPFDDEPLLEIPSAASGGGLDWAEEEAQRKPATGRLLIFVAALAVLTCGAAWWIVAGPGATPTGGEAAPTAADAAPSGDDAKAKAKAATSPEPQQPEPPPGPEPTPADPPAATEAPPAPTEAPPPDPNRPLDPSPAASTASRPKAATTPSSDVRALVNRGWSKADRSDYSTAAELFGLAAQADPSSAGAHFGIGYVAESTGRPDDAYRSYCVAWAYSGGDVDLQREIQGRLRMLNRSCD